MTERVFNFQSAFTGNYAVWIGSNEWPIGIDKKA